MFSVRRNARDYQIAEWLQLQIAIDDVLGMVRARRGRDDQGGVIFFLFIFFCTVIIKFYHIYILLYIF